MERESFRVSAPGKLMLLGEHAVLHGSRALVCAVNQRITVTCRARNDEKIHIVSSLGGYTTWLGNIQMVPSFRFVLTSILQECEYLSTGLDISIQSELATDVGLGSSAAVTAATMGVLYMISGREVAPDKVFAAAMQTIQTVQGAGSGADLAASIYGGILCYKKEPLLVQKVMNELPLTVVYSGCKQPTIKVISMVEEKFSQRPELFTGIYDVMDKSVGSAVAAIEEGNVSALGEIFNINQGLMDSIGVSNLLLSEINYKLRSKAGILGTKISGSGLGDCVIGVGRLAEPDFPWQVIPLEISATGLLIE